MKHASPASLDAVEDLLAAVRRHEGLREPKRGIFYRRSGSFLHFHEDPAGMFADLKESGDFVRYRVQTAAEKKTFLAAVARAVKEGEKRPK